jgi:hypothetical protein
MARIEPLPHAFPSRYGAPTIARVDTGIFAYRYFTHCLRCGFCHDQCCEHGVDVDLLHARAILRHADDLERYSGIARSRWFEREVEDDDDLPGGGAMRTRVEDGRCVFLKRNGRGCLIHAFCLERGIDYHDLKSIVDCLFPVTFEGDLLCPADEIADSELVCMNQGPTLYRGVRDEIRYYFGDACVHALDELELRALEVPV